MLNQKILTMKLKFKHPIMRVILNMFILTINFIIILKNIAPQLDILINDKSIEAVQKRNDNLDANLLLIENKRKDKKFIYHNIINNDFI